MPLKPHIYRARIVWDGNRGDGTATYAGYGREHTIAIEGKADLAGSADRAFRGDPQRHNPEDLFLGAVASCHMLSYLALAARNGVVVVAYEDAATATMSVELDGSGRFEEVVLSPRVRIANGDTVALARQLHERAHEQCFVANSCRVPIRVDAIVEVPA